MCHIVSVLTRKLNAVTTADAYPLPRVDDILEALNGNTLFSTLDLRSAYWQVSMDPNDCEKTAFSPPGVYMNSFVFPMDYPMHLPHFLVL